MLFSIRTEISIPLHKKSTLQGLFANEVNALTGYIAKPMINSAYNITDPVRFTTLHGMDVELYALQATLLPY